MLVLTEKGIVEIDERKMEGRIHKLKRIRQKIKGMYYNVYVLCGIVNKHIFKDEVTGEVVKVNEWGIIMEKRGRDIVHKFNMLVYKGEHRLQDGFSGNKRRK